MTLLRFVFYLAVACSGLLSFTPISAAGDTPTWLPSLAHSGPSAHDLDLTLKARKALFEDHVLAGCSLGISVRNRAATLWGAVPSVALSRHAEQSLKGVLGLTSVRNELQIDTRQEFKHLVLLIPKLELENQTLVANRAPSGDSRPRSQGVLVRRPPSEIATDSELRWRAPGEKSLQRQDSLPKTPTAATEKNLSTAVNSDRAAADLTKAVGSLRLADQRFRRIRARVEGDKVYLAGNVNRWDHLHELARSIARLPQVKEVVFEDVQADRQD
jgi:osmotically-inducible protein OsmY